MPTVSTPAVGTPKTNTFGFLKAEVARIVGGHQDDNVLVTAGYYLQSRIDEMNTRLYEFNLVTAARITTAAGTATYALPTAFYKEYECHEMDAASGGNKVRQLEYAEKSIYEKQYTNQWASRSGWPAYYTLFNFHSTGKVTFLPTPDKVRYYDITYYKRIALPTSDDNIVDVPREAERALVLLAQADILAVHNPGSEAARDRERSGQDMLARFVAVQGRHPDKNPRFRLAPLAGRRVGNDDIYIRIG